LRRLKRCAVNADVDANNETASSTATAAPISAAVAAMPLSYNNDAYSNAEVKGNSGERFGQVLKEMAAVGSLSFSDNKFRATSIPMRFNANKSFLHNCIELAGIAADKHDLRMLASKKDNNNQPINETAIQTIAMRIERATQNKMLEFEGSSEQINKKEKKPKTAFVTGLGTRIRRYKKRCWEAGGQQGKPYKTRFCLLMN
jgi:hypothetical protein